MSHLNPGLISAYNSLTDKHLAGYFSNTRIRRHLQRAGLITRSGRIVPDKEYRHKLIQRAHQRHVRECLAQAIFHKVLEMERVHQIEIKRRLEEFARRERVHKIKVERSKRYEEDIIRILSPRPPTGARGIQKQHSGPEGEHSESSESPGSSRPNTAPGKMQRPVRLKPIHSNSTTASLRRSSPHRLLDSSNENDQMFNCTMDKESRRRLTAMEASHGISPYCLPVINNFVTPVPPATKRRERGVKVTPSGTLRGRRLRPTTASSGADVNEEPPMLRSSLHQSRVSVNMMYFGKTVHLSHDLTDMRDEVKVFQQHCGGENLCVYRGMLREGETFQFISRRHRGFPFSLTFFLNGLQVERLSSCCEFKHRKGSRLGGRHGHFGFSSVEGASPCYKCIIAMGLDKKPTPPPKRVKEDGGREESSISPKDAPEMRPESTGEEAASRRETSQPQDTETQVEAETAAEEDKVRDDYEEDFEADDEGPAEDAEAKLEKSPSPTSETQRQVKERDTSETEDDEKDDDVKSRSGSSYSGSDREESDSEAPKDSREDEKAEQPKEVDQEESVLPPDEKDEPDPEEATATEAESAVAKDSDIQNSAGDSTEIDISDTSLPSGNENKQNDDSSGDKEVERTVDESKQEEEQERAKSVQEKLAEAILKESQCSSEPELSDTSTEEEEEAADKGPEPDNKDAVPERSVTLTEQQQTHVGETKCEEGVVGGAEETQDQDETFDPKEQEDETEQVYHQPSDCTKDEKVKLDEEDKKAASEESKEEDNKLEDTEDAGLHPVSEQDVAQDDKTSEPQEDTGLHPVSEQDMAQDDKTSEPQEDAGLHPVSEQDMAQDDKTSEPQEDAGLHPVSEKDVAQDDKTSEPQEDAGLHPVSEEKMAEDDKTSVPQEEAGLHPVSEKDVAQDDKASEPQEDAAAKSTDAAEEDEEKTAVEADKQPDETGQGAKSSKEDESLVSEPNEKTDETAVPDNAEAEAMTASETMEMKAEPLEEREPLICEEASVTDTDRAAASETEVTAENSSSSLEGSGDTTVEKTAECAGESGDNAEEEGNKDDIKEEEAEQASAVDDKKDDNQQERCELGEIETEKGVDKDDGEEKPEEEGKEKEEEEEEEEKQTNPDEITEGDTGEESNANEKDETGEDENNERETEESVENEEESTVSDSNNEQKAKEQAEETHREAEENVDESEKTEKDEDGECVKDKSDEEESEEKGPATDETNEGEELSETNTAAAAAAAAAEEKTEGQEKEQRENKDEQSEAEKSKDVEESEEKRVLTDATVEGEAISVTTEEPEKGADADFGKDDVKEELEDVSEAANIAPRTKTTDEEAEDVRKETEKASDNSENGEVDAENGEISVGAGNKAREDEGEFQSEGRNDEKTGAGTESEVKTEEPTKDESTEVKAATVESGDAAVEREDVKVDQGPDTDCEAMESGDGVEKQEESTKNISEPETPGAEIKEESESEDRKDSEEAKQDENANISDPDHENRDSDLIQKNDNVTEVIVASLDDQEQSPAPLVVDVNDAAHKSDELTELSDSKTDKHPYTDENAAVANTSAGDGENGDPEDASKESEEGASILLKPQAQSSPHVQNNEAENTEGSVAVGKETPEALETEDNTDLVTNWVAMHQASKYFETFVEPLEDLKESDPQESNSDKEAAPSAELPRSASPLKMVKMSENAEQMAKDVNDESRGEAVESELDSNHCEDAETHEKDPIKDTLQVEEETEVKDLIQEAESEEDDKDPVKGQDVTSEENKGRRDSPEKDDEGLMQDNTDVSRTEVESIAGTQHSIASGRPDNVSENQTEVKTTDKDPELNEKQTPVEDLTNLLPSSETEEPHEPSTGPEELPGFKANNPSVIEETWEKHREVTETSDFTEDGSQEESRHSEAHLKPSDESINGDRRDAQLIQDVQHTLSKDRLSTFSVDETMFGRSSYPLLTAARTESGH